MKQVIHNTKNAIIENNIKSIVGSILVIWHDNSPDRRLSTKSILGIQRAIIHGDDHGGRWQGGDYLYWKVHN